MDWNECVEEAKEELGYSRGEWIKDFDEVILLAKEKYWNGDNFKELKRYTIDEAGGKCEICDCLERLTAHHIVYGKEEETMCLCKKCHRIIHSYEVKRYGFVLQLVLLYWHKPQKLFDKYPNLEKIAVDCYGLINSKVNS
jgi:hypothetical protein